MEKDFTPFTSLPGHLQNCLGTIELGRAATFWLARRPHFTSGQPTTTHSYYLNIMVQKNLWRCMRSRGRKRSLTSSDSPGEIHIKWSC